MDTCVITGETTSTFLRLNNELMEASIKAWTVMNPGLSRPARDIWPSSVHDLLLSDLPRGLKIPNLATAYSVLARGFRNLNRF